jgi:hypothetical protein
MEDKAIEAANLHLENSAAFSMGCEFEKAFRECESRERKLWMQFPGISLASRRLRDYGR